MNSAQANNSNFNVSIRVPRVIQGARISYHGAMGKALQFLLLVTVGDFLSVRQDHLSNPLTNKHLSEQ